MSCVPLFRSGDDRTALAANKPFDNEITKNYAAGVR
jgi:hypothetical protein